MFRVRPELIKQLRVRLSYQLQSKFANDATAKVVSENPFTGVASGASVSSPPQPVQTNIGKIDTPHDVLTSAIGVGGVPLKTEPVAVDVEKSGSFDDIPGPPILQSIAKFWKVIPVINTEVTANTIQYMLSAGKLFGSQLSWSSSFRLFRWLLDQYGPIVRLHGPFGGDVVILSRPEHVNTVFQNEGMYPMRSCLDCIEKYRLKYRRYKVAGPFLMYGPEWQQLRKSVEKPLAEVVTQRFDKIEGACDDFVIRISRIRSKQDEVGPGFITEIQKWAMETLCSVTLNRKIGFLDLQGLSAASEPYRLLECLNDATDAIRRCENGLHLWKFVETPAWKSLVRNCDTIDGIINKYIQRAQESLRAKKTGPISPDQLSLMESLLVKEGIMPEDVLTVFLDMLLIGVNTTAHTIAFLLYHLARYPRVQHKLYEEIKKNVGPLSKDKLLQMKYLQACIKESLRLKPPMPILSRVLTKDVVVHNYRIPKGTYMLIATHLSSLREEHFEDANKFNPERWLSPETSGSIESFASIPFGYGLRACLAKDLAEIQTSLLLVKILRKFRIEYHYGDINSDNRLLAAPDRPLKFRFVDRL